MKPSVEQLSRGSRRVQLEEEKKEFHLNNGNKLLSLTALNWHETSFEKNSLDKRERESECVFFFLYCRFISVKIKKNFFEE